MSKNIRPRRGNGKSQRDMHRKNGKLHKRKPMKSSKKSSRKSRECCGDGTMKAIKGFILLLVLMVIAVGRSVSFTANANETASLHINPEASPVSRSTATVTEYIATDKDGRIIQSIAGFAAAKYDASSRKVLVADQKTDINKAIAESREAEEKAAEEASKEAAKETSKDNSKESAKETAKDSTKETAKETVKDGSQENENKATSGDESQAKEEEDEDTAIDDSRYVLIQNASDVTDITGSINREFYTIKTASDKVFYLIIDKSGNENNVHFLTEISENDLLHTTDDQNQTSDLNAGTNSGVKESALPNSNTGLFGSKTEGSNSTESSKAYQSESDKSQAEKESQLQNESKGGKVTEEKPDTLKVDEAANKAERRKAVVKLVLGLLAIAALLVLYYVKFVLKKKENYSDDEGFGSYEGNWFGDDDNDSDSDTVDFSAKDVEGDEDAWYE